MSFEAQGGDTGSFQSPGGFEFGIQGWNYADPVPKSITFYLDNTALVADQYGRRIKGVVMPDGSNVLFADSPPEANRENRVDPRPQFATHRQVVAALEAEGIDWLAYVVKYRAGNSDKSRAGLTKDQADALAAKARQDGASHVSVARQIACAGWPQLTYEELKELPELPPTPDEELCKIRNTELRRAARRARSETPTSEDAMAREMEEIRKEMDDILAAERAG